MSKIRFLPLASESMGTRSMCTFIETPDVRILVDPGVSMGMRWGLFPHPQEYRALLEGRKRIAQLASRSEVVTVSHYHFDHCTPTFTDCVWNFSSLEVAKQIFRDKVVLAKSIRDNINPSQRRRGWMLKKMIGDFVKEFRTVDGRVVTFGETEIKFSRPVFHGEVDTLLGWVLMMSVTFEGERVMHASDVQGPMLEETLNMILSANPSLVYLGGPPVYLADYRVDRKSIDKGAKNLARLAEKVPIVIVDHHLLRSEEWRSFFEEALDVAKAKGHGVVTAAEFLGKENSPLESGRKQLYEVDPPSKEFMGWTRLPEMKQKEVMPPL